MVHSQSLNPPSYFVGTKSELLATERVSGIIGEDR